MKILKHGDLIKVKGLYGTVGTIKGCAAEHNEDIQGAWDRDKDKDNALQFWASQEALVISNSPGYYDRRDKRNATAIELNEGELILLDGEALKVKFMGDYSDFVHFIK